MSAKAIIISNTQDLHPTPVTVHDIMKLKPIYPLLFILFLCAGVTLMPKTGDGGQQETASDTTSLLGSKAPEIRPGTWINSCPLTLSELHGKVVLVEFWTFGCYNCKNTIPHIKAWHKKFNSDSFIIIGVHTPEFDLEKSPQRVKGETEKLGITICRRNGQRLQNMGCVPARILAHALLD